MKLDQSDGESGMHPRAGGSGWFEGLRVCGHRDHWSQKVLGSNGPHAKSKDTPNFLFYNKKIQQIQH